MNILEEIVANKRRELVDKKERLSLETLEKQARAVSGQPDFVAALRAKPIGVIAEVKRQSPSAGKIRDPFDPPAIARAYKLGGAAAISCLMDERYFGGGEADFLAVRAAVNLPMLYKEFVVDPWQIVHAKTLGASAILFIVGALDQPTLIDFIKQAQEQGLQPLVETHDEDELKRAIDAGADCIGINNRNLKTFVTTLETTFTLSSLVPKGSTLISESGIRTADDLVQLKEAGAHAVLVGESLLRCNDLALALQQLTHLTACS